MSDGPYIEVDHSDNKSGVRDLVSTYDVDIGPLKLPSHIVIGMKSSIDGGMVLSYQGQVIEYELWLKAQIEAGDPAVCEALDTIYNKALGAGVTLVTRCRPQPYETHAHVVKRVILSLL